MNGKEYQSFHYFDKRTNEEDMPVMLPHNVQDKYEQMEVLFEEFFDDNSLSLAKVRPKYLINFISYFFTLFLFPPLAK
jgi:hypothetical protein